jgi:hypothetical protein
LYLNNFIYIEEYIIFMVTITVLAAVQPLLLCGIPAALVTFILCFLLFSPRQLPLISSSSSSSSSSNNNSTLNKHFLIPRYQINNGSFYMQDGELVDEMGSRIYLRGVNVAGKVPLGHTTWGHQPPRAGSFVGTLFELDSIHIHLSRLASCGFTVLRLNVTWEALEPEYEGVYDTAYISYLLSVVRACGQHNMQVVIDSHQDAWSRWTGGDGAPKWTMEYLGMDTDAFQHTRSAMLHCEDTGHLTWFTNYTLYGAGTMFALFFGGKRFAPATNVKGRNVQEWLQSAYIRAWCEVAKVLMKESNVLGFEPMNEPSAGWIGIVNMRSIPLQGLMGWDITPWDSIRLADGDSLDVASFQCVNAYKRTERANPAYCRAWKRAYTEVWKENGVWSVDEGLIKPGYFKLENGETFEKDYLTPFNHRFALAIHSYNPRWWILCYPKLKDLPTSIASPHWYDNITLVMNRYIPFLVLSADQSIIYPYYAPWAHKSALRRLTAHDDNNSKAGPFFLGEIGIPWLGSVEHTAKALESTMSAVDSSFISALTIWNYNSHHTIEKGDGWNLEDFSIWSPSLSFRMPNAVRPYVMVLAGTPVSMQWEPFKPNKPFTLVFNASSTDMISNTSIIFVPEMHYNSSSSLIMWANDGGVLVHDWTRQVVFYKHKIQIGEVKQKVLKISVKKKESLMQ